MAYGRDQDNATIYGCMDPEANNYNSAATVDDGKCEYGGDDKDSSTTTTTTTTETTDTKNGKTTSTIKTTDPKNGKTTTTIKTADTKTGKTIFTTKTADTKTGKTIFTTKTTDTKTGKTIFTGIEKEKDTKEDPKFGSETTLVGEVGMEAILEDGWYFASPQMEYLLPDLNNPYVGLYHLMQDGTYMVGEGVLNASHAINPKNIIINIGSGGDKKGGFGQFTLKITNLNLSRGEVNVTVGDIVNTVSDEELELQTFPNEEVTITTTPLYGFLSYSPVWSGDLITPDNVNSTSLSIVMNSDVDITVDFELFELTKSDVKERVADIFYKKFFQANVLTDAQVLAIQTTIRDGKKQTGRAESEPLVFYKKDRNTIENRDDLQGESFNAIIDDIHANNSYTDTLEDSFILDIYDYDGDIPEEVLSMEGVVDPKLRNYDIRYAPTNDSSYTITIATEIVRYYQPGPEVPASHQPLLPPYFTDALNLSQIVKPKTGTKINPSKAREILDTNIFELLPNQTTRQDQINEFFNEFNDLIGSTPPFQDVDNDGAGESLTSGSLALDSGSRVSHENKSTAYITRLNTHANTNNQGKTLESMRNKLNTYLGDVDNVVQVIPDQRPEYENKSNGFLKIRKPNQAIILRNSNDMLEFQKIVTVGNDTGPSFLIEGFTITMWVRFVGKTGRGTLFNFSNPTSQDSPYGFRLETITAKHPQTGLYQRVIRLGVRDHINNTFHDNSWGTLWQPRYDTSGRGGYGVGPPAIGTYVTDDTRTTPNWGYTGEYITAPYPSIPTDDLNEWFFICATFNPLVDEDASLIDDKYYPNERYVKDGDGNYPDRADFTGYRQNMGGVGDNSKLFWQNHWTPNNDNDAGGEIVANSLLGAKCKVEVISRSDLLRARGFKVGSLEANTESD